MPDAKEVHSKNIQSSKEVSNADIILVRGICNNSSDY